MNITTSTEALLEVFTYISTLARTLIYAENLAAILNIHGSWQ